MYLVYLLDSNLDRTEQLWFFLANRGAFYRASEFHAAKASPPIQRRPTLFVRVPIEPG